MLFILTGFVYASSVSFINPTGGEIMVYSSGYGTSATTIPVNLQYNATPEVSVYYIKFTDHNGNTQQSNQGNGIDQWYYLTPGTYTWKLDLYEWFIGQGYYKTATQTITFYVKHTLAVKNSFNGGTLNIDNITSANGSTPYKFINDNLEVGAIDQTNNGTQYVWNTNGTNNSEWKILRFNTSSESFLSINKDYDYTVQSNDNAATIKGYYKVKPAAPQNLTVTESTSEHPDLAWTANTESDLDYYNIYRKGGYPFVDWAIITTSDTNSYVDSTITTTYSHGEDYYYKVSAVSTNDIESDHSSSVYIEARLEKQMIDEEIVEEAPKVYALNSNYPNPFNPTTQISYQIPKDGFVNLTVYNSLGQEVAVLVDQQQSVGHYTVQFNADNLSSGIYFYRIASGEFNSVKKMLLVR